MSATAFDTVLHEALALPSDQRSFLATQLIASLDEEDDSITPAWRAEATKRADELDSGTVKPLSIESFKDHLESRVKA